MKKEMNQSAPRLDGAKQLRINPKSLVGRLVAGLAMAVGAWIGWQLPELVRGL